MISKVYLNYSLGADWGFYPDMPAYGKGYIAVIDFESMTVESISEDATLTATSGPTVYAPASFQDENGDLYFITDPAFDYNLESPSRIHRINSGSTEIDDSYTFNLSEHTNGGMGAAMWYLGDGKAIIRTRVAGDNIDAEHFFIIVDVQSGTYIKKLDLPADVAERMIQAVIIEDGKAYIAVTTTGRNFIWEYNPATDELTRGVELVGADIVKRIEKLQ